MSGLSVRRIHSMSIFVTSFGSIRFIAQLKRFSPEATFCCLRCTGCVCVIRNGQLCLVRWVWLKWKMCPVFLAKATLFPVEVLQFVYLMCCETTVTV